MDIDYPITFFYYDELQSIAPFYETVMGFELVLDQGMARIYRTGAQGYFGIVDGTRGHLSHQPQSAVLFTLVVGDVPVWHDRLTKAGVDGLTEIRWGAYCEHFFFKDPKGYAIEIQRFHDPAVAGLFR
jgi:predicted enzyme related to lactoylglutathione lyase